jgi:hypothetical protein
MMLNVARFANLVLAGSLVGNEFGTKVAIHPSVIVSCLPVLVLSRRTSAFLPTAAGTACFVGMLASTLIANVPINNRVLELSPETNQEEFVELREHWDRLHMFRVLLNVAGLALLCVGALSRVDRR